jgi:hypothetical protein
MIAMASDRQIAANQRNAKKSTGPTSDSGKLRSRKNAFRHGLAIGVDRDPPHRADVEKLAQIFSQARNEPSITLIAQDAATAELDLLRISKIRVSIFEAFHNSSKSLQEVAQLNEDLRKIVRYERRAFSRRRRALNSV